LLAPVALCLALGACSDDEGEGPATPNGSAQGPETLAISTPRFADGGSEAGLTDIGWCGSERDDKRTILESIGVGAAWLDDDQDGDLDLYVVNGSTHDDPPDPLPTDRYYSNEGGGRFVDVTAELGLGSSAWGHGVAAADYDNDADTDLLVTNWGLHELWQSQYAERGERGFVEVGAEAGVQCPTEGAAPSWGVGAAWGDVDNDGFLDAYVCHYLEFDRYNLPNGGRTRDWNGVRDAYYGPLGLIAQHDVLLKNQGGASFVDASVTSGVRAALPQYSLGVLFTDYDQDGDADIYVANDSMPNYLFVNDGAGVFEERGDALGVSYGEQGNAQAGMGVDAGDWNQDGQDDLLVTNFDDDVNTLYVRRGRGFRDETVRSGLAALSRAYLCWGCGLVDFEHDGDLDVFIASGHVYPNTETDDDSTSYRQINQVLLQDSGRLSELAPEVGGAVLATREVSRGAAFGDHDADGDVDVLVTNLNRPPTLYRNDTEAPGAWLQVLLVGERSNKGGVGARVSVVAGGVERSAERRAGCSFLSTNSPWLHFGLGSAEAVDEVRVRWPSGEETSHGPFGVNERVVLREAE